MSLRRCIYFLNKIEILQNYIAFKHFLYFAMNFPAYVYLLQVELNDALKLLDMKYS